MTTRTAAEEARAAEARHHLTATQKHFVGIVALFGIIAAILVSLPPLGPWLHDLANVLR